MNEIIKKPDSNTGLTLTKGKLRSASSPFQAKVNQAKAEQVDAATMPNRLCLMLDCSSSMAHIERGSSSRVDLLKDACGAFVSRCDLSSTAIAAETFPSGLELQLTSLPYMIDSFIAYLRASGNTPMHGCVVRSLEKIPMTRGIIVSDGEATDWSRYDYSDSVGEGNKSSDEILLKYKEAGIPIDCVHISQDNGGEALLRRIAEVTGGLFIKFTDVSAFSTAFGYLAPGFRAMLTDGRVKASDIGATEIR